MDYKLFNCFIILIQNSSVDNTLICNKKKIDLRV